MADRTYLLRNEIAKLIGSDPKLVRAYEELQRAALESLPELIEDANLSLESLDARLDVVEDALTDGAILVKDEGGAGADTHTIDFVGAGVTAAVAAGVATVTIPGASSTGTAYEAGPVTPPLVADLTWDNQGTSTATDGTGALILSPQNGNSPRGLYKAAPATPYDIYCRVDFQTLTSHNVGTTYLMDAGLMFKDTGGDNERLYFGLRANHDASGGDDTKTYSATITRWSGASPPVFSATPVIKYGVKLWPWLRVNNDGTTLTFYISPDGKNWVSVGTETLAAFIDGAASFGVFSNLSTADAGAAIFSYFSTTAPA